MGSIVPRIDKKSAPCSTYSKEKVSAVPLFSLYLNSWSFTSLAPASLCKVWVTGTHLTGLLWGLNETLNINCQAQYWAYSQHEAITIWCPQLFLSCSSIFDSRDEILVIRKFWTCYQLHKFLKSSAPGPRNTGSICWHWPLSQFPVLSQQCLTLLFPISLSFGASAPHPRQ